MPLHPPIYFNFNTQPPNPFPKGKGERNKIKEGIGKKRKPNGDYYPSLYFLSPIPLTPFPPGKGEGK